MKTGCISSYDELLHSMAISYPNKEFETTLFVAEILNILGAGKWPKTLVWHNYIWDNS